MISWRTQNLFRKVRKKYRSDKLGHFDETRTLSLKIHYKKIKFLHKKIDVKIT